MHLYSFIPYLAVLFASAFVAVSVVWDSNRRATSSVTEIFVFSCVWALVDLMGQLEPDPVRAIFWLRLLHLPPLLLGVSVLRLVIEMIPNTSQDLRPIARIGFFASLLLGLAATVVPGVVTGATATEWGGWLPHLGPVSILLVPVGCILPSVAVYHAARAARETPTNPPLRSDRLRSHAVLAAAGVSLMAALSTDYLLPILGIPFPRLGAFATALSTATMWIQFLHRTDDLALTPQGSARAVLGELHDGVALVGIDGTIISSNPRLSMLSGRSQASLEGMALSNLVDIPLDSIRRGLEDREYRLNTVLGERVPVSLSSSCVRNRVGDANWFVVVLRDLRSIDALRRRLLTSGRLAAVGELAAGIAHEVNNPVAFIRSDLNFLRSRLAEIQSAITKDLEAPDELEIFGKGASRIEQATGGIERIAEVVGDVRGFAHVGVDGSTAGDPEAILESSVRLARLDRHEEVTLSCERAEISKQVVAGQDLKQVMLALLRVLTVNSRVGQTVRIQPVVDGILLRIEMHADTLDNRAAKEVLRFKMAREDLLEASADNLGLAMAIELVDQLGGAVDVAAPTPLSLRIVLAWPFEEESDE